MHVSPQWNSAWDNGMGSLSSSGEHIPAFEDQRPADARAGLEVASFLLAACSVWVPANQNVAFYENAAF